MIGDLAGTNICTFFSPTRVHKNKDQKPRILHPNKVDKYDITIRVFHAGTA